MNRFSSYFLAIIASVFVFASSTLAVPSLSVVGGTTTPIASDNAFYSGVYPTMISSGALTVSETAILTFEFLGREADLNNSFSAGGNLLFQNATIASLYQTSVAPDSVLGNYGTFSMNAGAGALDFAFGRGVSTPSVFNNANPGFGLPNIAFILLDPVTAIILFDDYDFGTEDNHDDMVIRATAREIPEPATSLMILSGLGLLGYRNKRKASR